MAVSFDVASHGNTVAAVNSLTVAHTVAANTLSVLYVFGVVGVFNPHNDAGYGLTATYNGVSMTSLAKVHSDNGSDGFIELFRRIMGTGDGASHSIVLSCASTLISPDSLHLSGLSFFGVDQTTPETTPATAFGPTQPTSSTVVSVDAGNIALFGHAAGSTLSAATQTERTIENVNTNSAAGNHETQTAAGAGSNISSACTVTPDDVWASIGIEILADTGGAAALDVPLLRPIQQQIVHRMRRRMSGLFAPTLPELVVPALYSAA